MTKQEPGVGDVHVPAPLGGISVATPQGGKPKKPMPYSKNADLPPDVLKAVPDQAGQTLFREAFNQRLEKTQSELRCSLAGYQALEAAGYQRDEAGTYSKIAKHGDHSQGVMIAFHLDEELAAAMALKPTWGIGGPQPLISEVECPEELHITLFYLGGFDDVPAEQLAAAEKCLVDYCAQNPNAIAATIGGIQRFDASESSDWMDVVCAKVDSPALMDMREQLAGMLRNAGVEFSENFPFKPHVTLAYIDQSAETPEPRVEEAETELDCLVLCVGEAEKIFMLGDNEEMSKLQADAPNYRKAEHPTETCSLCVHGGDGYCDLYKFNYTTGWTCDSWEPMPDRAEKHTPPQPVQQRAQRGLALLREKGETGLHVTLAEKLANGTPLHPDEVDQMLGHMDEMHKSPDFGASHPSWNTWLALGGRGGRSWAKKVQRKSRERAMSKIQIVADIAKVDDDQHMVFGWASIIEQDGKPVTDTQGDQITSPELESMAYDFMQHVRKAGEMHQKVGVGDFVESLVFTKDKQKAMGVDLGKVGWWVGAKITDEDTWKKVKAGELKAFSIHGKGERTPVSSGT